MKSAIGILENICFPGKDPSLTYDAVVVGADKMLSSLCMTALETASPVLSSPTASRVRWAVLST